MHEVSIAHMLLEAVLKNTSGRVIEIEVEIGELRMINVDALKFAFSVLSEGTRAEKAKIIIKRKKPKFKCLNCGHTWSPILESLNEDQKTLIHFGALAYSLILKCPKCGSNDFEIIEGDEIIITRIKFTEND